MQSVSGIPKLLKKKQKQKGKKRKIRASREYQEAESEVNQLLESMALQTEPIDDSLEKEIKFFTDTLPKEQEKTDPGSTSDSSEEGESSPAATSDTYQVQASSSYIQIDEENILKPIEKKLVSYDDELLYIPSTLVNSLVVSDVPNQEITEKIANNSVVKMVNRYAEEGNLTVILSGQSLQNQQSFSIDSELYKSSCEHKFLPINFQVDLSRGESSHASQRLLKLSLRHLTFNQHTLQTEEHLLARRLDDAYTAYWEKIETIAELSSNLQVLRKSIQKYIDSANEKDLPILEDQIEKTKTTRSKLHEDEALSKTLLQNTLSLWKQLKKHRTQQGFHYTDFKLIIKVEQVVDEEKDSKLWMERFDQELNEIYREELQSYYKEKRLRKSGGASDIPRPQKPNIKQIRKELKATLESCTRQPGEAKIQIFKDKITGELRKLDKSLKQYFLKIYFDRQFVGITKSLNLENDFSVNVDEIVGVYLPKRMPEHIKISIFEKSMLGPLVKVVSIPVDLSLISFGQISPNHKLNFVSKKQKLAGHLTLRLNCEGTDIPQFHNQTGPRIDQKRESSLKNDNEEEVSDDGCCTFNEQIIAFCSEEEIESNPRFRLLTARYQQDIKYKDFKLIPCFDNEIEEETNTRVIDEGNWMDPIDLHRHKSKKYLQKLYDVIVNHCLQLSRSTEIASDLLYGNEPPTFGSILGSLISMFNTNRPLNPPKTVPKTIATNHSIENFNIIVNIVRASGIPVRNFSFTNDGRKNSTASSFIQQGFKYSNVRPYVCVSYKDIVARTMTADGSNPTWNEQIILSISGIASEFKDDIKIQLFDEYVEDVNNDEAARTMEVYQRIHANWLGEYRIPINTIFNRYRVDGVFELNSPKILIGYVTPSLDPSGITDTAIPIDNVPEIREAVYLWMYIGIEPQVEMLKVNTTFLECSELKEVKNHIEQWCFQVKEIQPNRYLNPLVSTIDGKRICLTRMIESIPLPIEDNENLMHTLRRFVSLVAVLKCSSCCMGHNGVWLNNQTILDTTWASPKDLGVLLAGYFLNMGIRCWLVLGISHPHGESVYVLFQEGYQYFLIDPVSGKKYSTRDVHCPMIQVFCVFGQDNVFCNIQSEIRVSMTNFNVEDSSAWLPLFNKSNPAPIGGFQKLNYSYQSSYPVNELRKTIERKVMKKINSWRSTRKTIWNRGFQSVLYDVLVDLELDVTYGREPYNYFEKIQKDLQTYKIFGFTMNFPYTNLSSISERIKSTGIHLNSDKTVEYGLAVYIHAYPNNILSVWLFLITATPLH